MQTKYERICPFASRILQKRIITTRAPFLWMQIPTDILFFVLKFILLLQCKVSNLHFC